MKKFFRSFIFLVSGVTLLVAAAPTFAVGQCFCSTDFGAPNGTPPDHAAECYSASSPGDCTNLPLQSDPQYSRFKNNNSSSNAGCVWKEADGTTSADDVCAQAKQKWEDDNKAQIGAAAGSGQPAAGSDGWHLLDPNDPEIGCAVKDTNTVSPQCKDVSVFVYLLFRIVNGIFGIIGALALFFFIYGGFTFILSQGNGEKVEQGTGMITAAVIGLVVAFGGYVLIKFIGSTLGVDPTYILK